jgi:hypothetical protein
MSESAVAPAQELRKPPVSVGVEQETVPLHIVVADPDTVQELLALAEGRERNEYALAALKIGVASLRHARGQVDAQAVRNEGERLLQQMATVLDSYRKQVQESVSIHLREYFDPQTGKLPERIERLIRQDGELEQALRRQVGREDSELVKTLSSHIGDNSQLMRLLNPAESQGVVKTLETSMSQALQQERERILSEFSLDQPNSALKRLVKDIESKSEQLQGSLADKIKGVVAEFSLDKEDSALNRLIKRVESAQKTITSEFSLDNEQSALSRMAKKLDETTEAIDNNLTLDNDGSALYRLRRELMDILDLHANKAQAFQEEVKNTLAAMVAKRAESLKSTRHGLDFEDNVCAFVEEFAKRTNDVAERTGENTGKIARCKVGDCVLELGPDSAAPGAKIVIEAKEDKSYDVKSARLEIEQGRENREAGVGLFVMSKRTASDKWESFVRYGNDVFVIWDSEDPSSDVSLNAALMLAKALAFRQRKAQDQAKWDLVPMENAIKKLEAETARLEKMKSAVDSIQRNGKTLADEIPKASATIEEQINELKTTFDALKAASE